MGAPSREILFVRFWSQVDIDPDGCWLWTGRTIEGSDGVLYGGAGGTTAHRVALEWATGEPIPTGCVVDHLCRRSLCVRPDHLEAVPQIVNVRRGEKWHQDNACMYGHAYTEANTYWSPSGGRRCRECHNRNERARQARRAAERSGR